MQECRGQRYLGIKCTRATASDSGYCNEHVGQDENAVRARVSLVEAPDSAYQQISLTEAV